MIDQLSDVMADLQRRGEEPLRASDLWRALQPVAQAAAALGEQRKFVAALQDRLMLVDTLPEDAPLGALIRRRTGTLAERATLYLGNGEGQPLSRLVPQPL